MEIFKCNQTSASLLVKYAEEKYYNVKDNKNIEKYLMIYDIFIKARSFYIINKIFFFLSLLSGITVLLWPSLAIFAKDFGWEKGFVNSAIVQTTVTGIAALTYSIYNHYKKRQMYAESLMRFVVYSEETIANIKDRVLQEMERIDSGFSFGKSAITDDETGEKKRK